MRNTIRRIKVKKALDETKSWWREKVNTGFHTGDADFDRLMKWICFQPFPQRLFGCSFLPHHDYGRGGRDGAISGRTASLFFSWIRTV